MNSPLRIEDLLTLGPWVRGLARAMLRDEGLADDVVHDTWMAALLQPPAQDGSLQGWLGQIARRLVLGRQRAARRRTSGESAAARTTTVPAVEKLRRAIDTNYGDRKAWALLLTGLGELRPPPAGRNAVFVVRTPEGVPMAGIRLAVAKEPA